MTDFHDVMKPFAGILARVDGTDFETTVPRSPMSNPMSITFCGLTSVGCTIDADGGKRIIEKLQQRPHGQP
jgi:hypothetical protein